MTNTSTDPDDVKEREGEPDLKASAEARMESLIEEYTPNPKNANAVLAHNAIKDAIADAHRESEYLTLKQVAHAIVVGLSFWSGGHTPKEDIKQLAIELEFLSNE